MSKSKIDILKNEIRGKCFSTKEAGAYKVSSRMLSFYVKKGVLERVRRGYYVFPEFESDEDFQFSDMVLNSKGIKESVICLISALSYWDITDEIPRSYWFAIPNNYSIPKDKNKIQIIRPRDLTSGVIWKKIAGQTVRITTPERSVCDAFKYLDEETAITSLRLYFDQDEEKVRINVLLEMASKLRSPKVVKIIKELTIAKAKDYPSIKKSVFQDSAKWLSANHEVVT